MMSRFQPRSPPRATVAPSAPAIADARGGVFPVGRYRHLVDAALDLGDPLQAWCAYVAALAGEVPNEGETRLYPFVLRSLGERMAEAPCADLLTAARVSTMRRTIENLRTAASVSKLLSERGIPHVYSKGLALVQRLYRRPDLRQSADVDIHIPDRHAGALFDLARELGWTDIGIPRVPREAIYATIGATTFKTPEGSEIDVHWRPRREFAWDRELTEHFFQTARDVTWFGRSWKVASDSWLLIETISHGLAYNTVAPLRWVVDAYSLVKAEDAEIDWALLRRASERAHIRPALRFGLSILEDLGVEIPAQAWPAEPPAGTRLVERMSFALKLRRSEGARSILTELVHFLLRGPGSRLHRLRRLPRHLRDDVYEYYHWTTVVRRIFLGRESVRK